MRCVRHNAASLSWVSLGERGTLLLRFAEPTWTCSGSEMLVSCNNYNGCRNCRRVPHLSPILRKVGLHQPQSLGFLIFPAYATTETTPCGLRVGRTVISTSCPKAVRKSIRRSTENDPARLRINAETTSAP